MATRRRRRPDLVRSVQDAVEQMSWLTPADQANVDLALRYAHQIEDAAASGDEQLASKMIGWLGPHLHNTLKSLGGAPAERKALDLAAPVKGRLAELRAARSA